MKKKKNAKFCLFFFFFGRERKRRETKRRKRKRSKRGREKKRSTSEALYFSWSVRNGAIFIANRTNSKVKFSGTSASNHFPFLAFIKAAARSLRSALFVIVAIAAITTKIRHHYVISHTTDKREERTYDDCVILAGRRENIVPGAIRCGSSSKRFISDIPTG